MTDLTDMDALAAEYVLGTLDAAERAAVPARRLRDPAFEAAIVVWERRLAPLAHAAPPVEPPAGLFAKIEQRVAAAESAPGGAGNIISIADLQRRVKRWRSVALAASAAAASLLVVVGIREKLTPGLPQNYVAVFQKDDASPAFLMSVDLASRVLTVRRVAAEVPEGKTYQLWIASDSLGAGPQSLGLVEDRNVDVRRALQKFDPVIVQTALFGVSLEPAGGSPTGKPTGPVFHAKLIPSAP